MTRPLSARPTPPNEHRDLLLLASLVSVYGRLASYLPRCSDAADPGTVPLRTDLVDARGTSHDVFPLVGYLGLNVAVYCRRRRDDTSQRATLQGDRSCRLIHLTLVATQ